MNSQQAAATSQVNSVLKNGKPVQFAMLFPVIKPLLDKDRAMQLTTFYDRLKERKISKDVFVTQMRGLVEDHIFKLAVAKLQEQASGSSQVASHSQFVAQQQHMHSSSPQSLEQQPQNMLAKLEAKVDELTKEKIDLENHLKAALSKVESLLAQNSSWDKERTILEDKVNKWIARAVKSESSNSELASKLQSCEAIYKAKLEELQYVHNAEVKKLQTELLNNAAPSLQDGYFTCADKFAASAVDVTRKLFENYCAELDSSLFIDAL
ncbi:hypothetical protein POM88_011411 [Heracleum sosnowskyi]|uniref:RST domain-containing protein n=1 Tax=Heracleum sosnowskyi TaxID=360622 RepID=A0AAD8MWH4_9APIA|nr:hypothetical protein POM88_011411 [Heracleum sosnowskyi]